MDWASAAVGLGGVAVALLTVLLTHRSRFAPYQQQLYERQLDATTEILQALGRYHDEAIDIIDNPEGSWTTGREPRVPLGEAKGEFFKTYRRWNVVVPQPMTEAVTKYLQTIEQILAAGNQARTDRSERRQSRGAELAAAYAAVVGVAQRELRVKTLSDRTLSSIESLAGRRSESPPARDPLYVRFVAESQLFEDFVAETESASSITGPAIASGPAGTIGASRSRIYVENRNLFLVHAWRPSVRSGQLVDISIRVVEHDRRGPWPREGQASPEHPLEDGSVEKVEYYLGASFRRAFVKRDASTGFRLDVSAFGPTLCVAWVHFSDGKPSIVLHRYLDFVPLDPTSPDAASD